ncbi:MAG: RagB/SusD family nutrient uptake outer membrane protein, partial [Bacteroides sp.]|nr:RagB/SusD family nutrient uptake outer membrane protein [Bacteroides sp.]
MKNKFLFIIFLIGCTLCSCDDILDAQPKDKLPQETFWKVPGNVRAFVTDVYSRAFPSAYETVSY